MLPSSQRISGGSIDIFFEALRGLHAQPHLCRDDAETSETLRAVMNGLDSRFAVLAGLPPKVKSVVESSMGRREFANVEDLVGAEVVSTVARADIGITWAEAGVANQGAILEVVYDEAGKLASSLPFNHVVLLSSKRIYGDVSEAMPEVGRILRSSPADRLPVISLISGPSKTGDIEMKLLYGVHGPNTLTVIALDWL